MASIVQDSTVNGKNWYRVRVGPWTTEKEAKHWLSLIKEIRGMEGSQIWENTR